MLNKLVSEYSNYTNKDETFREYILDLENRINIPHEENIDKFTDKEIFEYIEYLWIICATQY